MRETGQRVRINAYPSPEQGGAPNDKKPGADDAPGLKGIDLLRSRHFAMPSGLKIT